MARSHISTVVTSFWIFSQLAAAQHYPRNTALNGTTTTASPTTTSSSSGSATSFFSDIKGPFIQAYSSTWTQVIIPTTVGTVMVTVNEATNQTFSTTIYHTDYIRNGSATLLTRTDTDAAGTVTQVVTDEYSRPLTLAYPTNYFEVAESLTWDAILPTLFDNSTCCMGTPTLSATPTHTPFVQVGSLDTQDPRGWLYTLVGVNYGDEHTILDSTEVSSLWSGQTLAIDYRGCPYTRCNYTVTSVSPASAVQAQPGALLATSTTTISSLPAGGSTTSPKPASSTPSTPPATSTSPPAPPTTSQSAGGANTSPENTQPTSSPPQSTQVSGAPPQSSAAQITPPQSQQAPSTNPLPGSPNSNPVSAPAQPSGDSTAIPNPAPSSDFVTGGQTILPGSSITLGSGTSTTIIAVQTSGSNTVVIIGGSISSTLAPAATSAPAVTPAPVITIGSSTISANSASQFIIDGQTLVPGSSIVLGSGSSTTVIALQTSGSNTVLVVGSSSSTLVAAAAVTPPPITVGGSVITADSASNYVIAGQTLSPGGSGIVVGGTTISLASGGTQLVGGTKTIAAESTAIGEAIWSIFGGSATRTATGNAPGNTGSSNSSTVPPFVQSSGMTRIRPFWAAAVIPAALCSAALMWSSYG